MVDGSPTASPAASPAHTRGVANTQVVHLAFDVVRIDMPVTGIRHSRKVWNHVDELRLGTDCVARLRRNGLRLGAAQPDAWPALQSILDAAEAITRQDQLVTQPGLPVSFMLASIDEPESVFSYNRSRRLVGKTFQKGDKLINIDYALRPELGGSVDLQLQFEIRHDPGTLKWDRSGDTISQVPAYQRYLFDDLNVLVTLKPGEFLILGPSEEAANEFLVGGRFFVTTRGGYTHESIFCLTPRPYRIEGATHPRSRVNPR